MNRSYDEVEYCFIYKGRKYHRGNMNLELESGGFKMKMLDDKEKSLMIMPNNKLYSLGFGTYSDIVDIVETILKDQEYIKELELKINSLSESLRPQPFSSSEMG